MKKLVLFVCLMCGMMAALQAQNVVFSDNFDSYTAGQKLCSQNNTDWTTWSNSPGSAEDAVISTEQASSGSNSLKITGSNDIIYRFSNQTTGVFDVEFDYYIPSTGSGAYFNIQHYYNPGVQWAFECYFTNNGTGYIDVANNTYNFTMPNDAWFHVKAHIDLDMDSITVTVNNVDVHTWPFSYESNSVNGISVGPSLFNSNAAICEYCLGLSSICSKAAISWLSLSYVSGSSLSCLKYARLNV